MEQYKYLDFVEIYYQRTRLNRKQYTPEEVDQLEKEWGVTFPLAYRELFLIKGRYGFTFYPDNSYSIYKFKEMQEDAIEATKEAGSNLLDDKDIFVFSFYAPVPTITFFRLNEGENPPVYSWDEDGVVVKLADSFSDFVKMQPWYQLYLRETGQQ